MASKTKKPVPAPKNKTVGKPVKPAAKKSPTKKSPAKSPVKPAKSLSKKSPPPKTAAKPAPKKPAPKPSAKPIAKSAKHPPAAKPAPKKSAAPVKSEKQSPSSAKASKPAAKPVVAAPKAPVSSAKAPAAPVKAPASGKAPAVSAKSSARDSLRNRILEKSKAKEKVRPIAFSLDEIREIAKTAKVETDTKATTKVAAKSTKQLEAALAAKPAQPHHIKAASLADILGFNPKKKQLPVDDSEQIPEKFRRYYKLLIELRNHLTGQIDTHSEETLKRSSKDDAGDLSSYGQHMADAGTDTFDRDFALSLVSSEQEALSEVEAAVKRIKDGSYGLCEITQKPIAKERLLAVPFTRYSAEAQKNIERNRHRSRTQAGLFGEMGEEGATMSAGGSGDSGGDDE